MQVATLTSEIRAKEGLQAQWEGEMERAEQRARALQQEAADKEAALKSVEAKLITSK